MRAVTEPYPPASVVGTIVISRLGIPPGRHALHVEAVGLVTGQLDRLPSRVEYKKVICCDTCFKRISVSYTIFSQVTRICMSDTVFHVSRTHFRWVTLYLPL